MKTKRKKVKEMIGALIIKECVRKKGAIALVKITEEQTLHLSLSREAEKAGVPMVKQIINFHVEKLLLGEIKIPGISSPSHFLQKGKKYIIAIIDTENRNGGTILKVELASKEAIARIKKIIETSSINQ